MIKDFIKFVFQHTVAVFCFFFPWSVPGGIWDLSSLTRD